VRSVAVFMALMAMVAALPARAGTQARLMAEACATCHRPEIHSTIPSLTGRRAGEVLRTLLAFRDGSRPATIMDRITRGYSREELGIIAGELAGKNEP
jgi:sulfide dehydrogenase cytochrome subunit